MKLKKKETPNKKSLIDKKTVWHIFKIFVFCSLTDKQIQYRLSFIRSNFSKEFRLLYWKEPRKLYFYILTFLPFVGWMIEPDVQNIYRTDAHICEICTEEIRSIS